MLNKYNTELGRDLMTIIFLRTIDFIETTIENQIVVSSSIELCIRVTIHDPSLEIKPRTFRYYEEHLVFKSLSYHPIIYISNYYYHYQV